MFLFTFLPSFFMAFLAQKPIYTIFYKRTDECYLRWQRVTTNDNKWQRVATNDNNWYNEWQRVTTGGIEWREVTTSGNFGQTFFFQIMWCWYEPFFISSRQRLLQTEVIQWKHMESSCTIEDWILYWFFLIYKKIYILEFMIFEHIWASLLFWTKFDKKGLLKPCNHSCKKSSG